MTFECTFADGLVTKIHKAKALRDGKEYVGEIEELIKQAFGMQLLTKKSRKYENQFDFECPMGVIKMISPAKKKEEDNKV